MMHAFYMSPWNQWLVVLVAKRNGYITYRYYLSILEPQGL